MNVHVAPREKQIAQDFTYYKKALGGAPKEELQIFADEPQAGYYRTSNKPDAKPVAIAIDNRGKVRIKLDGAVVPDDNPDRVELWLSCAHHPVEFSVYQARIADRVWPVDAARVDGRHEIQDRMAVFVKKMKELKAKTEKTKASTQSDVDILAGYVQQGRALLREVKEVAATVKAPVNERVEKIKKDFDDPMKEIDAANKVFLDLIGEYGAEKVRQSNDPDYKFTAGKGGVGKTISLRKTEAIAITDLEVLIGEFGSDEKVLEAVREASDAAVKAALKAKCFELAQAEYVATGQMPNGVELKTTYKAA